MMPATFVTMNGTTKDFDLDAVYDVVRTYSYKRTGWTALVVYEPKLDQFIELRSSPPDIRGGSADEAEEISLAEIVARYGISEASLMEIRRDPRAWRLVDQRQERTAH